MSTDELQKFFKEHGIDKIVCVEEPECDIENELLLLVNKAVGKTTKELEIDRNGWKKRAQMWRKQLEESEGEHLDDITVRTRDAVLGGKIEGLTQSVKLLDGTKVWDEKTRNELLSKRAELEKQKGDSHYLCDDPLCSKVHRKGEQ